MSSPSPARACWLRGLITPGADVAARWDDAPVAARRAIARLLLTPDHLGELRVRRRPPGLRNTHVDAAERAEWIRTTPPSGPAKTITP